MSKKTMATGADLSEIFSSLQGEGLFAGAKQIFIRFAGCNLDCVFCDTSKVPVMRGVGVEELIQKIRYLDAARGAHHSVSLTGGEPLLQTPFLKKLLPRLKRAGFTIYLETNGTLHKELGQIIKYIDIIAMDFKLPSSCAAAPLWSRHKKFLKTALRKKVFVKAVVTERTHPADIIAARDIIAGFGHGILLVLQPASAICSRDKAVPPDRIRNYRSISAERLTDVRIIPQMHKTAGIR